MIDVPFDAISSLMIVLIGVPALVLQSLAPEIRRAVMSRWQGLLLETGLPVVVAVLVVAGGIFRQARLPEQYTWLGLVPLPPAGDWTWIAVMGILLLIVTYTAMRIPNRYGRREVIINNLTREAARTLGRRGTLVEHSLEDLIDLGRQSDAGQDKELVLQALHLLTVRTCAHRNYRGDTLEPLILKLVDILVSGPQPGNAQNFCTAAALLQHIVIVAHAKKGDGNTISGDTLWAVQALGALGKATLIHIGPMDIEHTPMRYVQALRLTVHQHPEMTTDVSQALFEIGVVAVQKEQMLIAMATLEELLDLVSIHQPVRDELATDVLGLIAHFWIAGPTSHEYVKSKLVDVERCLAQQLPEAIDAARRHCIRTTQFQTADYLHVVLHELPHQEAAIAPTARRRLLRPAVLPRTHPS
jgi:hypothetical protein